MDKITNEDNVFFLRFLRVSFSTFYFSDDKDRKLSVFQQTEMSFTLLIMHRVDCEGSVVLDKFRLFIKRGKISRNAQNWCQTFWILSDFDERKLYSEKLLMLLVFQSF